MTSKHKTKAADIEGTYFPYRFDKRYKLMFMALGVNEDDGVVITDTELIATYGRARVKTPLENVDHTQISGPHRWYTAVGLRLSFTDDGLTMGSNYESGLCIEFVAKIPKALGFKDHSALWVSVADPEGLAAALDG